MLRELENLLAEIARQQGLDVPQKAAPGRPREAPPLELDDEEVIEAEPVHEQPRRPLARTPRPAVATPQPPAAGRVVEPAELQLHEKFDQGLSHLDDDAYDKGSETEPQPGAAPQIIDWLRSPDNIRQAIIMSEILQRPLDRW